MKKVATILLLLLLVFNFIGYRFVFYAVQQQGDKVLADKLDKNLYNDADLVMITVPLSLPYLTNWKNFERTDGEITFNGKIYHYVKQKVYEGTLILMCVPDEQKMHLQNAKDDFFKLANELQNNSSSKKSDGSGQVLKLAISDYDKLLAPSPDLFSVQLLKSSFNNILYYALQKGNSITPEQPPEA